MFLLNIMSSIHCVHAACSRKEANNILIGALQGSVMAANDFRYVDVGALKKCKSNNDLANSTRGEEMAQSHDCDESSVATTKMANCAKKPCLHAVNCKDFVSVVLDAFFLFVIV